jgi:hypothetical protein
MPEECAPCLEATRKRAATFGLMTGGCSMLETEEARAVCQKQTLAYSDSDLLNTAKMGEFYASLIMQGDVVLFKDYFENYINRMQAEWFIAGVDWMKNNGKPISVTVSATYDWYKNELKRMNGTSRVKEIAL